MGGIGLGRLHRSLGSSHVPQITTLGSRRGLVSGPLTYPVHTHTRKPRKENKHSRKQKTSSKIKTFPS